MYGEMVDKIENVGIDNLQCVTVTAHIFSKTNKYNFIYDNTYSPKKIR